MFSDGCIAKRTAEYASERTVKIGQYSVFVELTKFGDLCFHGPPHPNCYVGLGKLTINHA